MTNIRFGPLRIINWRSRRNPNAGWDIRLFDLRLEIVAAYWRFDGFGFARTFERAAHVRKSKASTSRIRHAASSVAKTEAEQFWSLPKVDHGQAQVPYFYSREALQRIQPKKEGTEA